jgi:hypothetical protein
LTPCSADVTPSWMPSQQVSAVKPQVQLINSYGLEVSRRGIGREKKNPV